MRHVPPLPRALAALVLLLPRPALQAQEPTWDQVVRRLSAAGDHDVRGLAFVHSMLYIAAGSVLLRYDPATDSVRDVTSRVPKGAADQFTGLHFDVTHDRLWVDLNDNIGGGGCYSADLSERCASPGPPQALVAWWDSIGAATSENSIEAAARDDRQALVGFFHGDVALFSFRDRSLTTLYEPPSPYTWPVAVVLRGDTAVAGVPGDGLVAITVASPARVFHFAEPDSGRLPVRALALHGDDVYIGSRGLFRARLADLLRAH